MNQELQNWLLGTGLSQEEIDNLPLSLAKDAYTDKLTASHIRCMVEKAHWYDAWSAAYPYTPEGNKRYQENKPDIEEVARRLQAEERPVNETTILAFRSTRTFGMGFDRAEVRRFLKEV